MFYDRFAKICAENNCTPGKVAKELGINRSTLSMWKTRGVLPNAITIMSISNYFNISPAYLMGNDMAKEDITHEDRQKSTEQTPKAFENFDEQVKFALFNGDTNISDEAYEEVKRFAEFIHEKYKKMGDTADPDK